MVVRKIDPDTGDIVTSGNQFIKEREEIAQTVMTRVRLFLGEYFRDITDGTPWFQDILGKHDSLSKIDTVLKRRINQTKGVIQVLVFESDYNIDEREYSIKAELLTEYGRQDLVLGGSVSNG